VPSVRCNRPPIAWLDSPWAVTAAGPDDGLFRRGRLGHHVDVRSVDSTARKPVRTIGWSSASSTRMGTPVTGEPRPLQRAARPSPSCRGRGPIGLDLGAHTPEETAISIVAEIITARTCRGSPRLAPAARLHRVPPRPAAPRGSRRRRRRTLGTGAHPSLTRRLANGRSECPFLASCGSDRARHSPRRPIAEPLEQAVRTRRVQHRHHDHAVVSDNTRDLAQGAAYIDVSSATTTPNSPLSKGMSPMLATARRTSSVSPVR